MVWLEIREAKALEHSAIISLWRGVREAPDLSHVRRPTYGFRVTKPFTSKLPNGRFMPGMQGEVLHCSGNQAYVEVRDLFNAAGKPLKDWISRECITIGTKKYGTWMIDICQVPRIPSRLTSNELTLLNDPKRRHLALGVSTFLQTLAKTNPLSLTDENLTRLGGKEGDKVAWITVKVIEGITKAGLVSVLNNPLFTADELVASATLDCADISAHGECGIYLRRYIEPNPGGKKKLCSIYVGQSMNLNQRFQGWQLPGQHDELKENSESVVMYALCVLPKLFYDNHKFILEQLFVSLLETYKEQIVNRTRGVKLDDPKDQSHTKNCYDMLNIATQAAKASGWTGAVLRKSFWEGSYAFCDGLNWQSPIAESPAFEPFVWIRTDSFMPDMENGGKSTPIANFTREVPKQMVIIHASEKQTYQGQSFIVLHIKSELKDYQFRVSRVLPANIKMGEDWPAEDTYFNVVFEVRTDWKPHPYSWARLPLFGPFEDWNRANSWALSINWTDPSGKLRTKYLHCERPFSTMSDTGNGSIQAYARGIEVIHHLFRERIAAENQHYWLQTVPVASVKVIKHDHVNQLITLNACDPITQTPPISSQRKDPQEIKDQMQGNGQYTPGDVGLQNVGLTLAEARQASTVKFGQRRKCDSCLFLPERPCEVSQGKVCNNCLKLFGRPFCSWTPGIPPTKENTFDALEAKGDMMNVARRTALHGLKGWSGSALVSADPVLIAVDTGIEIDEMSDADFDAAVAEADAHEGEWLGP